jgi:hypothetical protein
MDHKNVDFNSDVVGLSQCIQIKLREGLALEFDAEYFGPVDLPVQDSEEYQKLIWLNP